MARGARTTYGWCVGERGCKHLHPKKLQEEEEEEKEREDGEKKDLGMRSGSLTGQQLDLLHSKQFVEEGALVLVGFDVVLELGLQHVEKLKSILLTHGIDRLTSRVGKIGLFSIQISAKLHETFWLREGVYHKVSRVIEHRPTLGQVR